MSADDSSAPKPLETTANEESAPTSEPAALPRGATVGRYLILDLLGQGAMGEVYEAYDPDLDRRVALKVMTRVEGTRRAREVLLREARALGSLSHPNVVQIHDVGEHHGAVFLAMELVEGTTLQAYATSAPSWREILAAYVDAARGLAAVHERGLVHRDVKPANILRGNDGRVRLADFGLVGGDENAAGGAASSPALPEAPESAPRPRLSRAMTIDGAIVGTPYYMAPEQHRSPVVTSASDQYALCASLYEGLYGVPPFPELTGGDRPDTIHDLFNRKLKGVGPPPEGSLVPTWVHAAVVRGLAPSAKQRYGSIAELVRTLTDDPVARRREGRRRASVVVLSTAVAVVGIAGWARTAGVFHDPCAHPEHELSGSWDEQVRGELQRAFLGTGRPDAANTFDRVSALLDTYSSQWTAMRGEACRAVVHAGSRQEALDLREACLDRRLGQLGALTRVLSQKPDTHALGAAIDAVEGLEPIRGCADLEALRKHVRPPEGAALRAQVAALQPRVDQLEALFIAARFRDAVALGQPLRHEAAEVPYPELSAQIDWWMGRSYAQMGDAPRAQEALREGAVWAAKANDAPLVAEDWAQVLFVVSERDIKLDQGAVIRTFGPSLLAQADDDRARRFWLIAEASFFQESGDLPRAKALMAETLTISERLWGPNHLKIADTLNDYGSVVQRMGDAAGAIAIHRRALTIREKESGPQSVDAAMSLTNLAAALSDSGSYAESQELSKRALAIVDRNLGPGSFPVPIVLTYLAVALARTGQWLDAQASLQRAVTVAEKAGGPEATPLIHPLLELGELQLAMASPAEAAELFTRALGIQEKSLGTTHASLEQGLAGLARADLRLGRVEAAAAQVARARALTVSGPSDTDYSSELVLAEAELALGQHAPTRAEAILEPVTRIGRPWQIPEAELLMANAVWSTDPVRAHAFAESSLAAYQQLHHAPGTEQATLWLAGHLLRG